MPIMNTLNDHPWILRLLASAISFLATILMGTNHGKTKTSDFIQEVYFYYWSSFLFFVFAYGFSSFFNFLFMLIPRKSPLWRLVVPLDWVITSLMIASCGMAINSYKEMQIGIVQVGWSPQCCIFPDFCNRVLLSWIFGCIGLAINVPIFVRSLKVLANPCLVVDSD